MASATPKYAAKSTIRSLYESWDPTLPSVSYVLLSHISRYNSLTESFFAAILQHDSSKNFSKGYTDMQAKVREATSNDPWGPSGTQMNELARATHNQQEFLEIMEILDKRMNDKGKNWRHVFKALTVLDYLLHVGSESVVKYARENLYIVKTLKEFQYIDEEGKDQGSNVRQKAKDITALLSDESRLKEERRSRNAMRDRMSGRGDRGDRFDAHTPVYEGPGAGDDDRDLQRALEESRRMAQNEGKRNSEDDDLQKALDLSRKEEQDRLKTVEKYNELSMTEEWEVDSKPVNLYEQQQTNTDFFANDFGGPNHNNNNSNFDAFSSINDYGGNDNNAAFLQLQQTGFNNPYLQFQQQQLAQQQLQQQQLMQQQLAQQQLQQQQQMAFMNMNNPYQQQMMPQMTGAPAIGSNNPFNAFAQKPAMTGFNANGMNGLNSNTGLNGANNTNSNNSNANNPLGELAFLQNSMSSPTISQPAAAKAPSAHDEKYASLANALSNRDDGMDTFGNTGQLRIPTYHSYGLGERGSVKSNPTGSAANPFQSMAGNNNANNSNSLIDIGGSSASADNIGFLGRSNTTTNNPFQMGGAASSPSNGFLSSQATGFGGMSSFNMQQHQQPQNNGGAYSGNTLF
ncbi:hypothetical protein BGZ83_002447 [Gryganskiella cystojenkinii]|nr:hypothetical protein BGZ83_002447 [Gryganskiella cystojenkinii]